MRFTLEFVFSEDLFFDIHWFFREIKLWFYKFLFLEVGVGILNCRVEACSLLQQTDEILDFPMFRGDIMLGLAFGSILLFEVGQRLVYTLQVCIFEFSLD